VILPLYPFLLDLNGFYSRAHTLRRRNTAWIIYQERRHLHVGHYGRDVFLQAAMLSRVVVVLSRFSARWRCLPRTGFSNATCITAPGAARTSPKSSS